jgi:hypothetical protein
MRQPSDRSGTDERSAPGQERLRARAGHRVGIAAVIGPIVGIAVGLALGVFFFQLGGVGFWMAIVGCAIFATAVALLVGGYSSLESPDPGTEPAQVADPVVDRPGLTREEEDRGEMGSDGA